MTYCYNSPIFGIHYVHEEIVYDVRVTPYAKNNIVSLTAMSGKLVTYPDGAVRLILDRSVTTQFEPLTRHTGYEVSFSSTFSPRDRRHFHLEEETPSTIQFVN